MWKCTNCRHVEIASEKPDKCPVCHVDAEKLVQHEVPGVKGEKTMRNLRTGFVAESQAHMRNLAFAMKADQEDYPQMAKLFRAIAWAEGVHAFNFLRILEGVDSTQENLEAAFERENLASDAYPQFIKEAQEESNETIAKIYAFARDAEKQHAKLYKKALEHMVRESDPNYYVCGICGYVSDGELPDNCPVCGAPKDKFTMII